MGDQKRVAAVRILADRFQPRRNIAATHSGVDQQAHAIRFDESCVSATPTSQDRDGYRHRCDYDRSLGQNRGKNGPRIYADLADRIDSMGNHVWIVLLLASFAIVACAAQSSSGSAKLRQQLEEDWKYWMTQYPELATAYGYPGQNMRWTDYSQAAIESRAEYLKKSSTRLKEIDRE